MKWKASLHQGMTSSKLTLTRSRISTTHGGHPGGLEGEGLEATLSIGTIHVMQRSKPNVHPGGACWLQIPSTTGSFCLAARPLTPLFACQLPPHIHLNALFCPDKNIWSIGGKWGYICAPRLLPGNPLAIHTLTLYSTDPDIRGHPGDESSGLIKVYAPVIHHTSTPPSAHREPRGPISMAPIPTMHLPTDNQEADQGTTKTTTTTTADLPAKHASWYPACTT